MRSILSLAIIGLVMALGSVAAAPAKLPYEPSDPLPAPAPKVDLTGTAWVGKYQTVNRTFIFEADGTVSYQSAGAAAAKKAKSIKNRGFWKLEGNKLYFEHFINPNQKLMEFRGVVKDGNTIVGETTYLIKGMKEPATLQRGHLELAAP